MLKGLGTYDMYGASLLLILVRTYVRHCLGNIFFLVGRYVMDIVPDIRGLALTPQSYVFCCRYLSLIHMRKTVEEMVGTNVADNF